VFNTRVSLIFLFAARDSWLSQANYIFRRLQITSNFEKYGAHPTLHFTLALTSITVLVTGVDFNVDIYASTEDPPTGFLFLCPPEDFITSPSSLGWPDCPAYPAGVDHLTLEEATQAGFPSFWLTTALDGRSWDASVYEGLHKFHQAKGFDPDTPDVTRHLGCSLYQLSFEGNTPFAHGESILFNDQLFSFADNLASR
jgi:hypothetical protein